MPKNLIRLITVLFFAASLAVPQLAPAQAQPAPYAAAAPLDQYLIADQASEVALARSAAPASISDGAEVLVLGRDGYTTAVKGGNRAGAQIGMGLEPIAAARAKRDVLHDVEGPVSAGRRRALASAHDVVRPGRCGEELGSQSGRRARKVWIRPPGPNDSLPGTSQPLV